MAVPTPRTAHLYVYDWLRSQILSGELLPGTPLVQATVARELGVSMTPVREALRDLATEGLITMTTHRGATVTTLDLTAAREIHSIRLTLEPGATRLALEAGANHVLERAEHLCAQLSKGTPHEWVALHREFHSVLLSPAPAPRLVGILNSLLESAALYPGVGMTQGRDLELEDEHRLILDAYRRRDVDSATDAVDSHIRSCLAYLAEPEGEHSEVSPASSGEIWP